MSILNAASQYCNANTRYYDHRKEVETAVPYLYSLLKAHTFLCVLFCSVLGVCLVSVGLTECTFSYFQICVRKWSAGCKVRG